jgi:AcrR family transcriptional regulator
MIRRKSPNRPERDKPETRVERRQEETRARILAAAAARFAAGLEAATLDDIAADADVARATLFNHFGSKDALLEALLAPVIDDGLALLAAIPAGAPRARVRALVDAYLALWERHKDALRVSYQAQALPLGGLAGRHVAFVRGVAQILEEGARAQVLHAPDGPRAARALARVAVPLLEVFDGDVVSARNSILGALLR